MKIKNVFEVTKINREVLTPFLSDKETKIFNWLFKENEGDYEFKICYDGEICNCKMVGSCFHMISSKSFLYFHRHEVEKQCYASLRDFRRFCEMLEIEDKS